jgi:small-conductance mechanosensitive channel
VVVDSDADPRAVEQALLEAATACDDVLREPAPSARFVAFGDSGLKFELLCWTDEMSHRPGALVSRLNFEINQALTRRRIRLPRAEVYLRGDDVTLGRRVDPVGGRRPVDQSASEAPR